MVFLKLWNLYIYILEMHVKHSAVSHIWSQTEDNTKYPVWDQT